MFGIKLIVLMTLAAPVDFDESGSGSEIQNSSGYDDFQINLCEYEMEFYDLCRSYSLDNFDPSSYDKLINSISQNGNCLIFDENKGYEDNYIHDAIVCNEESLSLKSEDVYFQFIVFNM